ncbi:hypothetical protein [Pseudomonas fluorescens]|uniref:hypothetical protein n=1 Tax=Pseudomonas fluorescens TaxID=294 RepID=UPI00030F6BA7|nr:hypothetical protein [Pseudomonas fluorescens]
MNDDGHKGCARAFSALMIAGQVVCKQIREREAKGSIYTITSHFFTRLLLRTVVHGLSPMY